MAQLGLKRKAFDSILLVALISVFAFAGTILTVNASPKTEFSILYILTGHTEETRIDNEQIRQFEMSQIGYIDQSTILLDEGIVGADIYFYWLAVHNKQTDIARASGTFKIISSGDVVLLAGTVMAEVRDYSTSAPLVEVRYLGHGYANILGMTNDIGFNIPITVEGYYW